MLATHPPASAARAALLQARLAMQSGEVADLAIFIICTCLLAGYILFYFNVPTFTVPLLGRRYVNLISLNRTSRGEWVQLLARDPKEGINAVQTIRNQVISVSILAAATVPLASTLINVSFGLEERGGLGPRCPCGSVRSQDCWLRPGAPGGFWGFPLPDTCSILPCRCSLMTARLLP